MGHTEGSWTQDELVSDLQVFFGADKLIDIAGLATGPTNPSLGLVEKNVPSTDAATFIVDLNSLFLRSGVFATPAGSQEQFGTAAAQPGPSTVSGTSGPLAFIQGKPPMTAAQMATVAGSQSGPKPKGIQINSIDVIYSVNAVNAAAATIGLSKTVFADNVAPVVTALLAIANNGLPLGFRAQPHVFNVPIPTPAIIVAADTELLVNLNLTAGAGGTITVFGIVVKASYNWN